MVVHWCLLLLQSKDVWGLNLTKLWLGNVCMFLCSCVIKILLFKCFHILHRYWCCLHAISTETVAAVLMYYASLYYCCCCSALYHSTISTSQQQCQALLPPHQNVEHICRTTCLAELEVSTIKMPSALRKNTEHNFQICIKRVTLLFYSLLTYFTFTMSVCYWQTCWSYAFFIWSFSNPADNDDYLCCLSSRTLFLEKPESPKHCKCTLLHFYYNNPTVLSFATASQPPHTCGLSTPQELHSSAKVRDF